MKLHGSAINRDTLTRNGSTYVQHNADDFAQANDAWFIPVSQKIGPDGCDYPGQPCACQSYGPGGVYWSYHHLKNSKWQTSGVGASSYRVHDGKGGEYVPPSVVQLQRDITYSDSEILAKEAEEQLLFRDMQSDLVQQVLRRLSGAEKPKPKVQ